MMEERGKEMLCERGKRVDGRKEGRDDGRERMGERRRVEIEVEPSRENRRK